MEQFRLIVAEATLNRGQDNGNNVLQDKQSLDSRDSRSIRFISALELADELREKLHEVRDLANRLRGTGCEVKFIDVGDRGVEVSITKGI